MFTKIIGIIGRIAVGKSSVAKSLSKNSNIPVTSFGEYLLHYSKSNGLPADRKSLQDLGTKFINENHLEFLENVLKDIPNHNKGIIIEGIRHLVIADDAKLLSQKAFLVYLDAPIEIRYNRYAYRQKESDIKLSFKEFENLNEHIVESELDLLKNSCDLILDSTRFNVEQITSIIISHLELTNGSN